MKCCNHECKQGRDCPARATPLRSTNGGEQVDTNVYPDQPWDFIDKAMWTLFKLGAGGFLVMTIIQISAWLQR